MIAEYRHRDLRVPVGGLLELEDDDAAQLIEDGVAVPVTALELDDLTRETR